jgi:hypothetical protein
MHTHEDKTGENFCYICKKGNFLYIVINPISYATTGELRELALPSVNQATDCALKSRSCK